MRLADSFPQNANAKLHIIFQISITFTAKIDVIINFSAISAYIIYYIGNCSKSCKNEAESCLYNI